MNHIHIYFRMWSESETKYFIYLTIRQIKIHIDNEGFGKFARKFVISVLRNVFDVVCFLHWLKKVHTNIIKMKRSFVFLNHWFTGKYWFELEIFVSNSPFSEERYKLFFSSSWRVWICVAQLVQNILKNIITYQNKFAIRTVWKLFHVNKNTDSYH